MNALIYAEVSISRNIISSASESETIAGHANTKEIVETLITLIEMGHL